MSLPGADLQSLHDLRRRLHSCPEVSGHEEGTARIMAEYLASCSPTEIMSNLGGHGLAAVFDSGEPGPTVLLRAELDALPIQEDTPLPWKSTCPGVSHKCGHDGHMSILAGVARSLAARPLVRGKAALLCQPAEETGQGAAAVIQDQRIAQLDPDWIFALHNLPGYPAGQILVREGAFAAGSAGLTIKLTGQTSHAAYPEQGNSPDLAMAELVVGLSTLPIPLEAEDRLALVTVGHARLGEPAFGITPGEAEIQATLRSDDSQVLAQLKERAEVLARQVAAKHGLDVTTAWSEEFPVTWNHPEAAATIEQAATQLGLDCVCPEESPFRWSEDCGYLLAVGKGAMFGLGSGRNHPPLHAGDYDFNDDILEVGVSLMDFLCRSVAENRSLK